MKIFTGIITAALAAVALQAAAQNYPTKPVRVILAFPPGSGIDIVGRLVSQKVGEYWGQNMLADNRGGAGRSIAAAIAANTAPDGYTLFINSSAHAVNPSMYAKLSYDPVKDFVDIAPLVGQPNVLIVHPGSPIKSFSAFLADMRARPGKVNFAFAGLGSGTHLNTEKFKLATSAEFTLVAYKGSAEAIIDVAGGRVDCYFAPISAGLPYIQPGRVRALAVTTAKRSGQLPDVPTIAEAGVPGFEFVLWFGLWAPAGTPAPIVSKIWKDFNRALADPGVREKLATLGNEPMSMTPPEFRKFVRQEIAEYGRIFKAAGIKPQ